MSSFVGIDLGTTFSAVSTIDETGRPRIIHNQEGSNTTPSVVTFNEDQNVEVGEGARRAMFMDPHTVGRFKRDMGTSQKYTVRGKILNPMELSALVLKKLKKDTEASIGKLGEVVVTTPANFSHEAREATMEAARQADLNISYIINEPTAAALYYAYTSGEEMSGVYAVYDLGGGTFDISIIRMSGQDVDVLATNGIAKLGGHDFDSALQKLVRDKYKKDHGEELLDEDFTKNDAEEEKKSLSRRDKVRIRAARKMIEISRKEFEESISTLITQTEMLCEVTLEEAGVELEDIGGVFLVGGSTRIPLVRESATRVFGQEPTGNANVDEVVALGAALYAAYKGDQTNLTPVQKNAMAKIRVAESTSKCFGVLVATIDRVRGSGELENDVIIRKGAKIPCEITKSFRTVHEGQEAVNCTVTESTSPEKDPRFVKIIWEGELTLPAGRPADQEIRVTYSYDENQIMNCSFEDVATGRKTNIDLGMSSANDADASTNSSTNDKDKKDSSSRASQFLVD